VVDDRHEVEFEPERAGPFRRRQEQVVGRRRAVEADHHRAPAWSGQRIRGSVRADQDDRTVHGVQHPCGDAAEDDRTRSGVSAGAHAHQPAGMLGERVGDARGSEPRAHGHGPTSGAGGDQVSTSRLEVALVGAGTEDGQGDGERAGDVEGGAEGHLCPRTAVEWDDDRARHGGFLPVTAQDEGLGRAPVRPADP
jgi:hypothetical protein